ncbi:MAG: DUF2497 domain-containing protein [Hyphomicrobium sp.]|jgi:cell pole-organizing protein PopZ
MSKPQMAAEPSMEEILSSIRKMISDDKPGPSPMPDQMNRTPFGESVRSAHAAESNGRTNGEGLLRAEGNGAAPAPNFNSLADALKVATALSDQRRATPLEVASALEKTPRSNLDALTELSAVRGEALRAPAEVTARAAFSEANGAAALPNIAEHRVDPTPQVGEGKRELLSFDFGSLVPQREERDEKRPVAETKAPIVVPEKIVVPEREAEATPGNQEAQPAPQARVVHLRNGLNGSANNGVAVNIAPFPRPTQDAPKGAEPEREAVVPATSALETANEPVAPEALPSFKSEPRSEERKPAAFEMAPKVEAAAPVPKGDQLGAHGEALLDAVVDLVQRQPSAISVFASGASFIGGIGGKKAEHETNPAASAVVEAVEAASTAETASPPKIDRAAAELLRPMLRQWLADNMGRILEDALRSELSDQTQGEKEPGKS